MSKRQAIYKTNESMKAIRGTVSGKTFLDPSVAGKVLEQVSGHETQPATLITSKLTDREIEVCV
jgi:DNA-binding NarL/FixJ family response regulator